MNSSNPIMDDEFANEDESDFATTQSGKKRKGNPKTADSTSKSTKPKEKNQSTARSWVWKHFTRESTDKDKCKCNYCSRILRCSSINGTSALKAHLSHCKEHKAWEASSEGKQSVIEQGDGSMKLSKCSEATFREACNEMIVLGELPFSFIDSLAWKHFCSKVNLYKPHSRATATRDIVKMYAKRKSDLMKLLKSNEQRVSLTTDIWVAPTTGASYMVVTAHFVDSGWHLRKLILCFKHILDHTGKTICSVLLECLAEWGITKIFTITVDNATSNTSALKKFKDAFSLQGNDALVLGGESMHLRCCAHIMNLVVNDGLNEVVDSVSAVRNAVCYVRSSGKRLDAFKKRVESEKISRGSLSLDCKTRWNSTYMMLTSALKQRKAFDIMEMEDKLYNDYFTERVDGRPRIGPPKVSDWDEVERLVNFLVIFYHSTLAVSASTTVNSYMCFEEIMTIQKNLVLLCNKPDAQIRLKANAMREKFDKYWGGLKEMNMLLIIASIFDPRIKMTLVGFCVDELYGKDNEKSKEMNELVMNVLKQLFDEYNNVFKSAGNVSSSQSQSSDFQGHHFRNPSQDMDKIDLQMSDFERVSLGYREMMEDNQDSISSSELELYLTEKVETRKDNPLKIPFSVLVWWKANATKFPVLASIAKDLFGMQVTSVASESAFSNSNRILEPYRSCLTHYMVEVLMCLEQWLKSEINMHEKAVPTIQEMLGEIDLHDELEREFGSLYILEE